MTALENMLREVIREEIRRLIRPDALEPSELWDDPELQQMALEAATRLRRVRTA